MAKRKLTDQGVLRLTLRDLNAAFRCDRSTDIGRVAENNILLRVIRRIERQLETKP